MTQALSAAGIDFVDDFWCYYTDWGWEKIYITKRIFASFLFERD